MSLALHGGWRGWSDKHFQRNSDDNNGCVQKWPQILPPLRCMSLKCVFTYQEGKLFSTP